MTTTQGTDIDMGSTLVTVYVEANSSIRLARKACLYDLSTHDLSKAPSIITSVEGL